jgi:hypothetical protein
MVNTKGGLLTAKQLINSREPSDGYTQLWLKGRLDLTVEALIVDDVKWHSLFSDEETVNAEARLMAHGYKSKASKSSATGHIGVPTADPRRHIP